MHLALATDSSSKHKLSLMALKYFRCVELSFFVACNLEFITGIQSELKRARLGGGCRLLDLR